MVEVAPPYDTSEITALLGTRVIVDALGAMVAAGKLGAHKKHIDKPVDLPMGQYDPERDGRRWSTPAKAEPAGTETFEAKTAKKKKSSKKKG